MKRRRTAVVASTIDVHDLEQVRRQLTETV